MTGKPRWHVEGVFAAVFLAALLATMTAQVVLRSGFGITISWLEEVIRMVFVWAVYACVLVAAVDDKHIRVAQHLTLFPVRIRKLILSFADLVWVAFNATVIYGATIYSLSLIEFPYRMPTTKVNLVWVFSIIPIAFTLLSFRILINIRRRWLGEIDMTDAQKEM
ncbi:TRAP transporter small permease [Tropicimonas sp. IMCC34043]|uniref:TRAP transporter small permease n=1 Tax=Tropicimonas sp. IMCC34043 TaxID=2248760 RepID=UPI000E25AED1|nr:TRAP transporter small permease [Tropicimonas sp. IMCC34043]